MFLIAHCFVHRASPYIGLTRYPERDRCSKEILSCKKLEILKPPKQRPQSRKNRDTPEIRSPAYSKNRSTGKAKVPSSHPLSSSLPTINREIAATSCPNPIAAPRNSL